MLAAVGNGRTSWKAEPLLVSLGKFHGLEHRKPGKSMTLLRSSREILSNELEWEGELLAYQYILLRHGPTLFCQERRMTV